MWSQYNKIRCWDQIFFVMYTETIMPGTILFWLSLHRSKQYFTVSQTFSKSFSYSILLFAKRYLSLSTAVLCSGKQPYITVTMCFFDDSVPRAVSLINFLCRTPNARSVSLRLLSYRAARWIAPFSTELNWIYTLECKSTLPKSHHIVSTAHFEEYYQLGICREQDASLPVLFEESEKSNSNRSFSHTQLSKNVRSKIYHHQ